MAVFWLKISQDLELYYWEIWDMQAWDRPGLVIIMLLLVGGCMNPI